MFAEERVLVGLSGKQWRTQTAADRQSKIEGNTLIVRRKILWALGRLVSFTLIDCISKLDVLYTKRTRGLDDSMNSMELVGKWRTFHHKSGAE